MADVELKFGPGPSIAILKTSLKAMGLKAGCSVGIEERSDALVEQIELCLDAAAARAAEASRRLPKTLSLCYRILQKRTVTFSANLGTETLTLELPPGQTNAQYDERIGEFYAAVAERLS